MGPILLYWYTYPSEVYLKIVLIWEKIGPYDNGMNALKQQ